MQLQTSPTNFISIIGTGLGFQMEKELEQVEMGLNSQKSFAKVEKIEM